MLKFASPFPLVGSYALLELDGATQLARIVARDQGGMAVVSLPFVNGSSGNRSVSIGELLDGTPLTPEERTELDGFCTRGLTAYNRGLNPRRNLSKQQRARYEILSARAGHARTLERLLGELARRTPKHQRAA
jgi:hypothetical protein